MSPRNLCACWAAVIASGGLAGACAGAWVTTIDKPDFSVVSDLTLAGAAVPSPGLSGEPMTLSVTPPDVFQAKGAAWHVDKQLVYNAFETTFTFRMRDQQLAPPTSDGITFTIQNQAPDALGGYGGALGAMTNLSIPAGNQGIARSISVCFDTWDNSTDWNVIAGTQRIFIQSAGDAPNLPTADATLASASVLPLTFNDGALHTAKITYTRGLLSVYVDDLTSPRLTASVRLDELFTLDQGTAWVGFTAGTGGRLRSQRHEITSWTFATLVPAPGTGALLLGAGAWAMRRRRA
jgi:hypothetical protein